METGAAAGKTGSRGQDVQLIVRSIEKTPQERGFFISGNSKQKATASPIILSDELPGQRAAARTQAAKMQNAAGIFYHFRITA